MRALLCLAIFFTSVIGVSFLQHGDASHVAFKHPASASDLNNFYRSIQALSADSLINGTAAAIV